MLRIIIENKLSFKLRDCISYAIRLYQEQGVKMINRKAEHEILEFIKERMRNVLKLKNIKTDIIEASISALWLSQDKNTALIAPNNCSLTS